MNKEMNIARDLHPQPSILAVALNLCPHPQGVRPPLATLHP